MTVQSIGDQARAFAMQAASSRIKTTLATLTGDAARGEPIFWAAGCASCHTAPEAEPSAKTMIELIKHIKEHKVGTVFFESFASDRAIKSIAKEAKVKVDMLQPLGNITADEAKANLSYEDIMRQNLQKIAQALECK